MSTQHKQLSCVSCKAYLFEEDDVVHCPVCGAPHHRECYNKIGHCAVEDLHGTPDEYDSSKLSDSENEQNTGDEIKDDNLISCRMCGERYDSSLPKCPKCSIFPNSIAKSIYFLVTSKLKSINIYFSSLALRFALLTAFPNNFINSCLSS